MNTGRARFRSLVTIGLLAALGLTACGGDDDTEPAADSAADQPADVPADEPGDGNDDPSDSSGSEAATSDSRITIADFEFSGVSEVPVGTTVTVTNDDAANHTWTSVDGMFDSGGLRQGDSFEFTFTEPGSYDYFCAIHPNMTGTIVVTG